MQTIIEHYATPREARQRVLTLRAQGVWASRVPDYRTPITSGTDLVERHRAATTVRWEWTMAEAP
jgi:hypothetical protein